MFYTEICFKMKGMLTRTIIRLAVIAAEQIPFYAIALQTDRQSKIKSSLTTNNLTVKKGLNN